MDPVSVFGATSAAVGLADSGSKVCTSAARLVINYFEATEQKGHAERLQALFEHNKQQAQHLPPSVKDFVASALVEKTQDTSCRSRLSKRDRLRWAVLGKSKSDKTIARRRDTEDSVNLALMFKLLSDLWVL
jgi:hypothetical protein